MTAEGDVRAGVLGVVTFEETGHEREVLRVCARCARTRQYRAETPTCIAEVNLVSPSGLAHIQDWDGAPKTACGIDATGPEWWWRL